MKVRSKEELVDRLTAYSGKRKRELVSLDQLLSRGRMRERIIARRAAIVFSYAHWEGFVKDAATAYVQYVAFRMVSLEKLTSNFQAISCRNHVLKASKATKRIEPHIKVVLRLTDMISEPAEIAPKSAIDTESNLSWDVFENICRIIGIDYSSYWPQYGPFMDDLFQNRCAIAHGEFLKPDEEYAKKSIRFTLDAIDWFKTDILNALQSDAYLRQINTE